MRFRCRGTTKRTSHPRLDFTIVDCSSFLKIPPDCNRASVVAAKRHTYADVSGGDVPLTIGACPGGGTGGRQLRSIEVSCGIRGLGGENKRSARQGHVFEIGATLSHDQCGAIARQRACVIEHQRASNRRNAALTAAGADQKRRIPNGMTRLRFRTSRSPGLE